MGNFHFRLLPNSKIYLKFIGIFYCIPVRCLFLLKYIANTFMFPTLVLETQSIFVKQINNENFITKNTYLLAYFGEIFELKIYKQ